MIEQTSLFPEFVPVVYETSETLDERFNRWISANPGILRAFIEFARQMQSRGRKRVGAKLIIERLRWEHHIASRDTDFALNNNYTSRLARRAVASAPELAELFEFRELRS